MSTAESIPHRVDAWFLAPADPRRLAALRIGLCAVVALRLAIVDYGVAARNPALYQPRLYMHVFTGPPSPGVVTLLQAIGVIAAVTAAAGLAIRGSLPVALVCALFLEGLRNSAGRIVVGDALLLLCLIALMAAGSASAAAWSLQRHRAPPAGARFGWPVRTMMAATALTYFLAGVQKWRFSGIAWVTSDNLRWILFASSDVQVHANRLALFLADRPLLAHILAGGALLLETCFPLVLVVPRLRWVFVPGAVAMHLSILLAMHLDYSAQLLTVVIVFVNWPSLVAAVHAPVHREVPG